MILKKRRRKLDFQVNTDVVKFLTNKIKYKKEWRKIMADMHMPRPPINDPTVQEEFVIVDNANIDNGQLYNGVKKIKIPIGLPVELNLRPFADPPEGWYSAESKIAYQTSNNVFVGMPNNITVKFTGSSVGLYEIKQWLYHLPDLILPAAFYRLFITVY